MQAELKKRVLQAACAPYRPIGISHHQWAKGKMGFDPVFPGVLDHGLIPDDAVMLDLGCGRGFMASWILAAEQLAAQGKWDGTPPPKGMRFHGVELVADEVDAGNRALQALHGDRVSLLAGDMRHAAFPSGLNVVTMFDVLHYVPHSDQDRLLDRIRQALGSGGLFITRVGDAQGGMPFRISQFVDRFASFMQGHRLTQMWCRPVSQWVQALESRGFVVKALPMNEGTPFANVLLTARLP